MSNFKNRFIGSPKSKYDPYKYEIPESEYGLSYYDLARYRRLEQEKKKRLAQIKEQLNDPTERKRLATQEGKGSITVMLPREERLTWVGDGSIPTQDIIESGDTITLTERTEPAEFDPRY